MRKIGKYEIELRNFKVIAGHNDSLPFQAVLYINGNKIGSCHNDGWGGDCVIDVTNNKELFEKASLQAKKTHWFRTHYYTINIIIDEVAGETMLEKEQQKMVKRNQAKNLIFKNEIETIKVKTIKNGSVETIETVVSDERNLAYLKMIIAKYEKQGYVLLNTNIPK